MTLVTTLAFAGLAVSAVLLTAAVIRRPSIADRMVALDQLLLVFVAGVAVLAFATRDGTALDLLVVAALLGFVGTVAVARFLEGRGA